MLFPVHNDTRTPHVTPTSDHDDVTSVELDEINDLPLLEVELDGIIDADLGIRKTDRSAVVSENVGNTLAANSYPADLEELVGGLLGGDAVDGEAALHIIEKSEMLAGFLNGDDIHVPSGVGLISANLVIDFDEALLDDSGNFTTSQGVLQPVSEEDGEGERFAELVGAGRGAGSICSAKFVQHP